jgi:hypothetical protein
VALSDELPFQFVRVIALAAGPRFFPIRVPTTLSIECVLHANEFEKRFPVWPLFGKGRIAEADFDPLNPAVVVNAGTFHVSQILRSRDRTSPQAAVINGPEKLDLLPRFNSSGNQVTHKFCYLRMLASRNAPKLTHELTASNKIAFK